MRAGLDLYKGDAVAIMMADGSDDPADLVRYHRVLEDGFDCAFGSRFIGGRGRVSDYPRFKLILNRLFNWGIRVLFRHGYDDTTNAFKAYRREVIETVQPLLANQFNLTVEMPLKAIVRGHSYGVVPISWHGRSEGTSKLDLREMGSRYVFIVLYVFLERYMSRGDYMRPGHRPGVQAARRSPQAGVAIPRRARRGRLSLVDEGELTLNILEERGGGVPLRWGQLDVRPLDADRRGPCRRSRSRPPGRSRPSTCRSRRRSRW